jgi:hypothetical protein
MDSSFVRVQFSHCFDVTRGCWACSHLPRRRKRTQICTSPISASEYCHVIFARQRVPGIGESKSALFYFSGTR